MQLRVERHLRDRGAAVGIGRKCTRTRSLNMVGKEPAVPVLLRRRTMILERHEASAKSHTWIAVRVDEVTLEVAAAVPPALLADTCSDLELGAHVAGMQRRAPKADNAVQVIHARLPVCTVDCQI